LKPVYLLPFLFALIRIEYSIYTDYVLPDEALYYITAHTFLQSHTLIFAYSLRILFQLFILGFSILLNLDTVQKYLLAAPLISSGASALSLVIVSRIQKHLAVTHDYALYALAFSLSFIGGSIFMLSEIIALPFILFGLYAMLKKRFGFMLSSMLIGIFIRETFLPFLILNLIYALRSQYKRRHILLGLASIPFLLLLVSMIQSPNSSLIPFNPLSPTAISGALTAGPQSYILVSAWQYVWNLGLGLIGAGIGLGILFMFAVRSLLRREGVVWIQILAGLLCFLPYVLFDSRYAFYGSLVSLGTTIRYSYGLLPIFAFLKPKPPSNRMIMAGLLSLLILGSVAVTVLVQRPANGLESNAQRAASFLNLWSGYQTQHEFPSLVYAVPLYPLNLYLNPIVTGRLPPGRYASFNGNYSAYQGEVFVYGESYSGHYETLIQNYPYLVAVLLNQTQYHTYVLWNDSEGYLCWIHR
jgi:hypothetical protein